MPLDLVRALASTVRARLTRYDLVVPPDLDTMSAPALLSAADDLRLEGDPLGDVLVEIVASMEVGDE